MSVSVEVKTVKSYEVLLDGESLGVFNEASSWNGMMELVGENGCLIVNRTLVDSLFSDVFGWSHSFTAPIIKAGGKVIGKLVEKGFCKMESAAAQTKDEPS